MFFSMIRRKPTTRKLWDKTTDRWEHDMYREEEQGPKTKEELEVRSRIGRFQKISIPIPRTASRISKGKGCSLNWNSEGMGGIYDWKSEGMGGGVSQVGFPE